MSFIKSIKFRLILWYLCVIAALFVAFGLAAYITLSYQLHISLDKSLMVSFIDIEKKLALNDGEVVYSGTSVDPFLVYSSDGNLLINVNTDVTFTHTDITDILAQVASRGKDVFSTYTDDAGAHMRIYAKPLLLNSGIQVVIVIGKSLERINETLGIIRSIFGASAIYGIILALLGGVILTNRAFYPLMKMKGAAEDFGENNLGLRMQVFGEDEFGRLASSINRMMERLEISFKKQKQFSADASHELRTPLSIIEAEATLSLEKERTQEEYKNSLEVISREVEFMSSVLSNLLLIARSEAGQERTKLTIVDIRDILTELSTSIEKLANEKGLRYDLEITENLPVEGDPVKLKQLFTNIFENAIRYTPYGGFVSGTATKDQNSVVISISDTGIGIAPENISLIFERFYRVDKAHSRAEGGAGLGLSIAKQIVELHGGTINVDSKTGKGSTFHIFLPLAVRGLDDTHQITSNKPT